MAALTLVGAVLRLYRLTDYPSGIHGDETEFGLIATSILEGKGPNPFGSAFFGERALIFHQLAWFMAIFGRSLTVLRLFSALLGLLTLPAFYILVRRSFGIRPALISLALLAGSAVHINFSRLGVELSELPLLACIAIIALREGQQSGKTVWWLLAGIFGALAVYSTFGGAVVPLIMAVYLVYLLAIFRRNWRSWLTGGTVAFLGGALTLLPAQVYQLGRNDQYVGHLTSRLIFNNWPHVTEQHHTSSLVGVLWAQLRANVLIFFTGTDAGPFYPFAEAPMVASVLGPLTALGLALTLLRLRDSRFALVALWFWSVIIVGGVLSTDSPQAHRLLPAVLPALIAVALALDWLTRIGARLTVPLIAQGCFCIALLMPLVAGYADNANYFGPAAMRRPWEPTTVQARYIAALGPEYRVYTLGTPNIYFNHSVTRFLAPTVEGASLNNPGAELPLSVPGDRDLGFLSYSFMPGYLPLLQSLYPNGRMETVPGRDGPVFTAFLVPRTDAAHWQGLSAHYGDGERVETDPSNFGGGTSHYPAPVTWSGSIYAERSGRYTVQADGARAEIEIDGTALTDRGERDLTLGWHAIKIKAQLPGPLARLSLKWIEPGRPVGVIPLHRLDARSIAGAMHGRLVAEGGLTAERRDRTLGFRSAVDLLAAPRVTDAVWDASLNVPRSGPYRFILNSTNEAEITLDGRRLVSNPGPSGLRTGTATIDLNAGLHPIAVRYVFRQGPGIIEVLWVPPGEQPTIIPPDAFGPPLP